MPVYSWCETPIEMQLTVEKAEAYNRVAEVYERLMKNPASSKSIWEFLEQTNEDDRAVWKEILYYVDKQIESVPEVIDQIIESPDSYLLVQI